MTETNLLAYLAIQCRVECISDLRLTPRCKRAISLIEIDTFVLSEWQDAIQYLCKENKTFESVVEAKNYLIEY